MRGVCVYIRRRVQYECFRSDGFCTAQALASKRDRCRIAKIDFNTVEKGIGVSSVTKQAREREREGRKEPETEPTG